MSRNQLDQSTSPYLLLHKDNPVHWYQWGPEAFAEAEATGKPILLSIGYSACHWCHVMNNESFANAETAALMNDSFINVKVDRAERPDIDVLYQGAAGAMGSTGGWPLNAFLTPTGAPFSVGTYLPNEDRAGTPGFRTVLQDMSRYYREQPEAVARTAANVNNNLDQIWNRDMRGPLGPSLLENTAVRIAQKYDIFFGGLTGTQKFPQPHMLELLFRAYLRTGMSQFFQVTSRTLDPILLAGVYDHVGGGFFRYASDERWLFPHFEKLTADNALLIDFITLFWQHQGNALCRKRVEESVAWLLRDMKVEGAFATSVDADLDGEEGKYYIWTEAEVDAALVGTFSQKFKAAFGISRDGNYRGRNVLRRTATAAPFAQSEADEALFAKQIAMLQAARAKRPLPLRDDQVLADVNGMVITALANAGAAMRCSEWVAAAIKAFDFVIKALGEGDTLHHSWRNGTRGHHGFADDYAHMSRAALALWEATGEKRFLDQAQRWVHTLNENFWNAFGDGYYTTSHSDAPLFVRPRSIFDQGQPPANAVMLGVLSRLQMATADGQYGDRCNKLVQAFSAEMTRAPISAASFLNGIEFVVSNLEIVVMGPAGNSRTMELVAAVQSRSLPNKLLAIVGPDQSLPEGHPAKNKTMEGGIPTAYICQHGQVSAPITNPVALSQILQLPPQTQQPQGTRPQ